MSTTVEDYIYGFVSQNPEMYNEVMEILGEKIDDREVNLVEKFEDLEEAKEELAKKNK
jgi:5-bromo-4-chloroindolyl phosphate hydrolysis protein